MSHGFPGNHFPVPTPIDSKKKTINQYGGFINVATAIAGWFIIYNGKSEHKIDDKQGYPLFQETSISGL
jgi:hypothetical protein